MVSKALVALSLCVVGDLANDVDLVRTYDGAGCTTLDMTYTGLNIMSGSCTWVEARSATMGIKGYAFSVQYLRNQAFWELKLWATSKNCTGENSSIKAAEASPDETVKARAGQCAAVDTFAYGKTFKQFVKVTLASSNTSGTTGSSTGSSTTTSTANSTGSSTGQSGHGSAITGASTGSSTETSTGQSSSNGGSTTGATTSGMKITGKVNMDVTLPSGTTADAFVKDVAVIQGVKNGVAAKAQCTPSWVSVMLSVDSSSRRLHVEGVSIKLSVDYIVTVPSIQSAVAVAGTQGALGGSGSSDITAWGQLINRELQKEKPHVSVMVTGVVAPTESQGGTTSSDWFKAANNQPRTVPAHCLLGLLLMGSAMWDGL